MTTVKIFTMMRQIWLYLVATTEPFFDWLTTELEVIEMSPFELIFGAGILIALVHALMRFMMPI